jgi:hypothetical protein
MDGETVRTGEGEMSGQAKSAHVKMDEAPRPVSRRRQGMRCGGGRQIKKEERQESFTGIKKAKGGLPGKACRHIRKQ